MMAGEVMAHATNDVREVNLRSNMLFEDTSPEIERMQIELLRQMPVARKLELVAQTHETGRILALAGLRRRYPDDDPARLRRRLASLLLGEELAARAYGPGPEDDTC